MRRRSDVNERPCNLLGQTSAGKIQMDKKWNELPFPSVPARYWIIFNK